MGFTAQSMGSFHCRVEQGGELYRSQIRSEKSGMIGLVLAFGSLMFNSPVLLGRTTDGRALEPRGAAPAHRRRRSRRRRRRRSERERERLSQREKGKGREREREQKKEPRCSSPSRELHPLA